MGANSHGLEQLQRGQGEQEWEEGQEGREVWIRAGRETKEMRLSEGVGRNEAKERG